MLIVEGTPAICHWHASIASTVDSTDAAFALPTEIERAITGKARAIRPAPIFFWFTLSPILEGVDFIILLYYLLGRWKNRKVRNESS